MTEKKRTDELVTGDTVRLKYDNRSQVRTVTYTQPSPPFRTALVFDDGTAGQWAQDAPWELLGEEELAAAKAAAHTEGMAQALEHAAALIREHKLPAPRYDVTVSVVLDTFAELQPWAKALGATIRGVVSVDGVAEFGGVRLDVHAQSMGGFPADEQEPDVDGDGPVDGCRCEDCDELAAEASQSAVPS